MDTANLLRFLRDANQHGYAAGRAARQRREADHSTTITYEAEEWALHDNYFAANPTAEGRWCSAREDPSG